MTPSIPLFRRTTPASAGDGRLRVHPRHLIIFRIWLGLAPLLLSGLALHSAWAAPPDLKPSQSASATTRLHGRLRQAGGRQNLAGATVVVASADAFATDQRAPKRRTSPYPLAPHEIPRSFRWLRSTTTDEDGTFRLDHLPRERVFIFLTCAQCERVTEVIDLRETSSYELLRFLAPLSEAQYSTVVQVQARRPSSIAAQSLSAGEIATMPGSAGDPARALQNLPGIGRGSFSLANLRIRGAAPGDSQMVFGEHPVPTLLHFGGLNAIVQAQTLSSVDFAPGNFQARYGNAIGGIVRAQPRAGRRDGYHGHAKADLFDAGILAEGPLGRGSFLIAGRRSYADSIAKKIAPADLHLTPRSIPVYYDGQIYFDHPLGKRSELSTHVIASYDRSTLFFLDETVIDMIREPPVTAFARLDAAIRTRFADWQLLTSAAYGLGRADIGGWSTKTRRRNHLFSWRQEGSRALGSRLRITLGNEIQIERGRYTVITEQEPPDSAEVTHDTFTRVSAGFYASAVWSLGRRLEIQPETRIGVPAWFNGQDFRGLAEPRLHANLRLGKTRLRAATGSYAQGSDLYRPGYEESRAPDLGLRRSWQTSIGVDHDFGPERRIELTFFHKHLWNLRTESTYRGSTNRGYGRIVGAELLLRQNLGARFYGWIAYTLMRSDVASRVGQGLRRDPNDQTHLLTALFSMKLPYRWTVGARFRLTSGNLYTPVIGSYLTPDTGQPLGLYSSNYVPIWGKPYSKRTPMFYQFDLRVDRSWYLRRCSVTAYLDLFNLTNALNIESYALSYDARLENPVYSLPIFPALGMRVEF